MIDFFLLGFAFTQGVFAFFAPCAVALLPGYLSAFVTRNVEPEQQSKWFLFRKVIFFSFVTILGIITVYGLASLAIMFFAAIVKKVMVYLGIALGLFIVILGVFMIKGKTLSFSLAKPKINSTSQVLESYLFGVSYSIGALACLFPFFLVVATSALQSESFLIGTSYFVAYMGGMSIFMLGFYVLAVFSKKFLQSTTTKIMPYLHTVGGVVVVLAGLYIIWYQGRVLLY